MEKGLAKSRSQAQQIIQAGLVLIDGRTASKASAEFSGDITIEITDDRMNRYVSRGGLKLEGALRHTGIRVDGIRALDVGISTGGFTDCLLQAGAAEIVGVDVGQGQLSPKISSDPRVKIFESVNARELTPSLIESPKPFDLAVVDVSFISLELILPPVTSLIAADGKILALVKPQFEAGRAALGKTGVVKDPKAFEEVRKKIYKICELNRLDVEDYFESAITGTDGNQEFFLLARPFGIRERVSTST